ncbi:MAG: hypothetical protein ACXWW5_03310, partial [Actinomycetota bacterium]
VRAAFCPDVSRFPAATLSRHGWDRAGLSLSGFGGVLALVLAETVAGAAAFTWCTPLWNEAKRSYFALWGVVVTLVFALWAWWAARSVAPPDDAAAVWSVRLTLATLVAVALSALLLLLRRRAPSFETAGRIVGIVSVPIAVGTLAVMAATGRQAYVVALFQLLAGAAFLGAAFDGLFLGHWYLTDRKLTRAPINRATDALLIASMVEIVAVVTSGFGSTASSQDFNPLLTAGALAPWIAVGMAAATLLIAVLVRAALKGERANAVQSATGFYYLAVVTAFTAEIAVKTRFFPG